MMEKGKISALQMSLLIYPQILATGVLSLPGIAFQYAKRDMWLTPIWGSFSGFLVVFIVYQLHKRFPHDTLVQYSQKILGRFLGKAVGFFYLLFYLYIGGTTLRQYGDFLVGAFLPHTPLLLVMGSLALASTFAVRAGLEVLARLSDMLVPILFFLWFMIILLLLPDLEVKNMLPIMEHGIMPSLQGAIAPMSWNALFFFISSLMPFLRERERGLKWGVFSVLLVMMTLVLTNLATLLLFGGITGGFVYPVMSATRYISLADFFENLQSLVMAIWIGGTFIKLGLVYYVTVLSTAQWLNLTDYKPITCPCGLLITLFGVWVTQSLPELAHSLDATIPIISGTLFIFVPAILLMIALFQNRNRLMG